MRVMISRMMNIVINFNNFDVIFWVRSMLIIMSVFVIINDGVKKFSVWCKGDKFCNVLRKGRRFNVNVIKKRGNSVVIG